MSEYKKENDNTYGYGEIKGGYSFNITGFNYEDLSEKSNYSFIGGGYSCSISSSPYAMIGGSSETPEDIEKKENDYFISESLKLDGELILKYSPRDFKWKAYYRGEYYKVDNIEFNCKSRTDLYYYNYKTIGVLIVEVNEVYIEDKKLFIK